MKKIFTINIKITWAVYIFLDIVCTGIGMGIPVFCILLGFPAGWYIAKRALLKKNNYSEIMLWNFLAALATSAVTFILMMIIWARCIFLLFDPQFDFSNFGHPNFLYDPYTSFIGWLVLMIVIAPFLQVLTTVFASQITLLKEAYNESL